MNVGKKILRYKEEDRNKIFFVIDEEADYYLELGLPLKLTISFEWYVLVLILCKIKNFYLLFYFLF